jgi:hypothetical protein
MPHCPKCGYFVVTPAYHAADAAGCCGSRAEHLRRTCDDGGRGCGYAWAEACADISAAPPRDGKRRTGGLPPFSGRDAHCPKCEDYRVKTRYLAPRDDAVADGIGEHMSRECGHCGYRWAEACADAMSGASS